MKSILILAGLMSALLFSSPVYGFGGCEEDCAKCHALDQGEAKQILSKMKVAGATVTDVRMSPIRGLWEVTFEDRGSKRLVYVGFSKKYVMSGSIFEVETAANKTQETLGAVNKPAPRHVDYSKIPLGGSVLLGEKEAQRKVVVFTDPDCPYCAKLHGELKKIVSERKDIAFYLKLFPLKIHPDAYWKAQSIFCGNSIQRLEDNFERKQIPKPDCETKIVDDTIKLAGELGITGTPTLVMPDGLVVVGAKDAATILDLLEGPRSGGEK